MDDERQLRTMRGYQLLEHETRMLSPAMEDYLETVYRQSGEDGSIRITALAEQLKVKVSSSSKTAWRLGKLGMLKFGKSGTVMLTQRGREIGQFLLARHGAIEEFLRFLSGGQDVRTQTELIEHGIDAGTAENLRKLCQFFTGNRRIAEKFREYQEKREDPE